MIAWPRGQEANCWLRTPQKVAIPRSWYRAQKPLKPGNTNKKYERKLRNPPPRVGPRKYEKKRKIPKKYKNGPKITVFVFFLFFFFFFFRIFGARPGVGDSVIFSYYLFVFPGLRGF